MHFQHVIHFFSNFPAYYSHLSSNSLYKNSQGRAMYSLFRAGSLAILTTSIQSLRFADQKALRQVLRLGFHNFQWWELEIPKFQHFKQ
jgi:hypothetical protein